MGMKHTKKLTPIQQAYEEIYLLKVDADRLLKGECSPDEKKQLEGRAEAWDEAFEIIDRYTTEETKEQTGAFWDRMMRGQPA